MGVLIYACTDPFCLTVSLSCVTRLWGLERQTLLLSGSLMQPRDLHYVRIDSAQVDQHQ